MKKWQMIKTSTDEKARLWLNLKTGEYSIWCNKTEILPSRFTVKTTQEDAEKLFDKYLTEKSNNRITLPMYLALNGLTLTELEIDCLHCMLSQGSFYEEAALYDEEAQQFYVDAKYGCFFGWEIYESEVPGCRGAIASLVKKGILTVSNDGKMEMYNILCTPIFKDEKQFGYHKLDLDLK